MRFRSDAARSQIIDTAHAAPPPTAPQAVALWLANGRAVIAIAIVSIVAGIVLRFTALEHKVFWDDEIYSAFAIFGESEDAVNARVAAARSAADLHVILEPPRIASGSGATIAALASQEPQHAPPFFVLEHWWVKAVGASLAHMRLLAAVVSLLALPAMYALCLELFAARRAALIGIAFIALSPVQIVYAQEVREYGLWCAALLVMTALFVRATRVWTVRNWGLYAISLIIALYVYPLSFAVAIAQLAFIAIRTRSTPRRLLLPFAAGAIALVAFGPWLVHIVRNLHQINHSMAVILQTRTPAVQTLRRFFGLLRINFLDFDRSDATLLNALLSLTVLPLIVYASALFCRRTAPAVWGPIVALVVAAVLPTVVPDLLGTGSRTSQTRYFLPLFLGVDIVLTYAFFVKTARGGRTATAWSALLGIVLGARLVTGIVGAHASTWWNKLDERSIAVAAVMNAQPNPWLVGDNYAVWDLSVAYDLRPNIGVELRPRCYLCSGPPPSVPSVPRAAGVQIFLLGPSPALRAEFRSSNATCIDIRATCASAAPNPLATSLSLWPR